MDEQSGDLLHEQSQNQQHPSDAMCSPASQGHPSHQRNKEQKNSVTGNQGQLIPACSRSSLGDFLRLLFVTKGSLKRVRAPKKSSR